MIGRAGRKAAAAAAALGAGMLVASAASAGATSGAQAPLQIAGSSLVQQGQNLVWQVQMVQPFSPGRLARDRRTLCLLLAAARSGTTTGELCLAGPARHSVHPRLLYRRLNGAHGHVVTATVTRTSSRELTASFLPSAVGLAYRPLRWQVVSSVRTTACAPPAPSGGSCFVLYPAKPALLRLHTPVLKGCAAAGPSLVYHGPARGREIALTFDDGPWDDPPTWDFVRVLEREHVPATFFDIGREIATYDARSGAEKQMLADGDMIGDHTWSHPEMPRLSAAEQRAQLLGTVSAIRQASGGFTPCLWRPPYGDITPSLVKLARSLGLVTVMWDVDPRDWALPGVGEIVSNVVAHAHPGAIVIQHVGGGPRHETLEALPREIGILRSRGYHFVTVTQLLGLKLLYR